MLVLLLGVRLEKLLLRAVADRPADRDRHRHAEQETATHHRPQRAPAPERDVGGGDHDRVQHRRGEHERHRRRGHEATLHQSARDGDRSALADRERETGGRGRRQLQRAGEHAELLEHADRHEHLDERGGERSQHHERERLDQDRAEDHEERPNPRDPPEVADAHRQRDGREHGGDAHHGAPVGRTARSGGRDSGGRLSHRAVSSRVQQYLANDTANPWKASASILSPSGAVAESIASTATWPVTCSSVRTFWSRNSPPGTVASTASASPGTASSTAFTSAVSGTARGWVSHEPVPATATKVEPEVARCASVTIRSVHRSMSRTEPSSTTARRSGTSSAPYPRSRRARTASGAAAPPR